MLWTWENVMYRRLLETVFRLSCTISANPENHLEKGTHEWAAWSRSQALLSRSSMSWYAKSTLPNLFKNVLVLRYIKFYQNRVYFEFISFEFISNEFISTQFKMNQTIWRSDPTTGLRGVARKHYFSRTWMSWHAKSRLTKLFKKICQKKKHYIALLLPLQNVIVSPVVFNKIWIW